MTPDEQPNLPVEQAAEHDKGVKRNKQAIYVNMNDMNVGAMDVGVTMNVKAMKAMNVGAMNVKAICLNLA